MEDRLSALEMRVEREQDARERAIKYAHNMMEDLQAKMGDFGLQQARFDERLRQHTEDDSKTSIIITRIFDKLEAVQRLVWIGIGGVLVVGSIVGIVGGRILHLLAQ